MIVVDNKNEITRSGDQESVVCTIAATGKSFRVTSDGLYKDKPLTIVRELCCNAYDSHVEAGKATVPFDLHLPTALEPFLEVRDYGVGMDKKFMKEIFPQYFVSTKTKSNDTIGAMGLGSKSPLSYCESFNIISWINGEQNTYQVFWNEEDLPEVALLDSRPSTEAQGVKVTVPVNRAHIQLFAEKAYASLKWFDTKPNLTGARMDYPVIEDVLVGTGWRIIKHVNSHYRAPTAKALQGKVEYEIDASAMGELSDIELKVLQSSGLIFDFKIGDLAVTASREGLSYKNKTIENIRKAVTNFVLEVTARIQEDIKKAKTFWEAKHLLTTMRTTLSGQSSFFYTEAAFKNIKFDGRVLGSSNAITLSLDKDFPELMVTGYTIRDSYKSTVSTTRDGFKIGDKYTNIAASTNTLVVIEDDVPVSYAAARAKKYLIAQTAKTTNRYSALQVLLLKDSSANLKKVLAELGDPEYIRLDSIEYVKPKSIAGNRPKGTIFHNSRDNRYIAAEIDFDAGGFYVERERNNLKFNGIIDNWFHNWYDDLKSGGVFDADAVIAAPPPSELKKYQDSDLWVNVYDHVKEVIETKYVDSKRVIQDIKRRQFHGSKANHWYATCLYDYLVFGNRHKTLDADKTMFKFLSLYRDMKDNDSKSSNTKLSHLYEIAEKLKVKLLTNEPANEFDQLFTEMEKEYPMLEWVLTQYSNDTKKYNPVFDYIKLVDNQK